VLPRQMAWEVIDRSPPLRLFTERLAFFGPYAALFGLPTRAVIPFQTDERVFASILRPPGNRRVLIS